MSLLNTIINHKEQRARRLRTGWIGVEIGACAIKIAQVERIAKQYRMARNLVVRADENEPFDTHSFEAGRVGREIREAIALHGGFQGRIAACTLAMNFCELRTLVSAQGSEDEQRELISLELDDSQSAESDAREFEFWDSAQRREDEQGMTQVHVLSIPRALSDCVAANLLDGGLKCQVLDGIPFTTLRAVEMNTRGTPSTEESVAVLDWDHSSATFVVIRDGQPLMARSLRNCGLQRLLDAIGQHLKLSAMEAEALLTLYGVENPFCNDAAGRELQAIVTGLSNEVFKEIVDELNETLSFLKMQFTGLMPSKIWLTGAGSAIRNVTERLESQIGTAVAPWSLPGRVIDPDQPLSVLANASALSALAWEL